MKECLEKIYDLESSENFNEAFHNYQTILKTYPRNFEIWKHYYFFLWSMIEDVEGKFTELKNEKLNSELTSQLNFGENNFDNNPEFNFLAGWTLFIFPDQIGSNYEESLRKSSEFLNKALEMEPQNPLFKMICSKNKIPDNELQFLKNKTVLKIQNENTGKGLLNEYFREAFARK